MRDWRRYAACAGVATDDSDPFFPDRDDDQEAISVAVAICARCLVRPECLEYALQTDQRHGIWGGYSQRELRQLIARRLRGRTRAHSTSATHRNARKTHCQHGHAFTAANTYYAPSGERRCRICLRAACRRAWRRAQERGRSV